MTVPIARTTPLSIPAFRRVWMGMTVSTAGDAASWIALVALALGPNRASLTVLAVFYTAPVALGGLAAGWALDRFDPRRLIILDSLLRAAVFASIPLAMVLGGPSAVQLYAVAAAYGLLKMVSLAGFPTLIPSLVPESQLDQANALEGTSFGVASLCGAALAGIGVATVGAGAVIAADAASYLVLAIALLSVRGWRRQRPAVEQPAASMRALDVMRLAVTNPVIRKTTIMFALFNVGEGCMLVFLPHRAVDLGLGSAGYGYFVAATTGGGLLATVILLRIVWRPALPRAIVGAQLAATMVVTLLAVPSTATTVAALVAFGLFTAPMTAWAQSLRMRLVPPEGHGRLFALLRTTMQATPPLGAGLAALVVPHGALITVVVLVAVMGIPAVLLAPGLVNPPASGRSNVESPVAAAEEGRP